MEPVTSSAITIGHHGAAYQLRPLETADSDAVLSLVERNHEQFTLGKLANLPRSADDYRDWIKGGMTDNKEIHGVFARQDCVGFVGVQMCKVGTMPAPAIGAWYAFDKRSQGIGLATRSVAIVLSDFLKRKLLRLDTVVLHIHKTNKPSQRLAQRLGFARTPTMDYDRFGIRGSVNLGGYASPKAALLKRLQEWVTVKEKPEEGAAPAEATAPAAGTRRVFRFR